MLYVIQFTGLFLGETTNINMFGRRQHIQLPIISTLNDQLLEAQKTWEITQFPLSLYSHGVQLNALPCIWGCNAFVSFLLALTKPQKVEILILFYIEYESTTKHPVISSYAPKIHFGKACPPIVCLKIKNNPEHLSRNLPSSSNFLVFVYAILCQFCL